MITRPTRGEQGPRSSGRSRGPRSYQRRGVVRNLPPAWKTRVGPRDTVSRRASAFPTPVWTAPSAAHRFHTNHRCRSTYAVSSGVSFRCRLPEVCSFQLPEVCSFRLPLTAVGRGPRDRSEGDLREGHGRGLRNEPAAGIAQARRRRPPAGAPLGAARLRVRPRLRRRVRPRRHRSRRRDPRLDERLTLPPTERNRPPGRRPRRRTGTAIGACAVDIAAFTARRTTHDNTHRPAPPGATATPAAAALPLGRFIPARAGEIGSRMGHLGPAWVWPRSCGVIRTARQRFVHLCGCGRRFRASGRSGSLLLRRRHPLRG